MVITGGRNITSTSVGWNVPKADLVSKLQALLHAGDLRIVGSLPNTAVQASELQDVRVRYTEAENTTFNA